LHTILIGASVRVLAKNRLLAVEDDVGMRIEKGIALKRSRLAQSAAVE
jgi:hypothetical protein